jgi:sugar/nucleoside kinase (ribokinase family)
VPSAPQPDGLRPARSPSALSLGETLVDLVCPVRGVGFDGAESFVPRLGGAPTNVAVIAAALGVDVALGGGVGDDRWGDWLARRLLAEGVSLRHWHRLPGVATAVAFVVVDDEAVPDFTIYGGGIEPAVQAFAQHIETAVAESDVVVIGSNTMLGAEERAITLDLRARALARGAGVLLDANLRLARWADPGVVIDLCRQACEGAVLVKTSAEEAQLLTGEHEAVAAAHALCRLGAESALVTCGADGAVLRGRTSAEVDAIPARVVDTTGAGDAMTGSLVAGLTLGGGEPDALVASLRLGAFLASRATEMLGSLTGAPLVSALAEARARGLAPI